jgi:hypothetical protein
MVRRPQKRVIYVDGTRWEVSAVIEGVGWDAELPVRRENWLSFETDGERRFITPLPEDWASWSDERMREELAKAPTSKRRSFGG